MNNLMLVIPAIILLALFGIAWLLIRLHGRRKQIPEAPDPGPTIRRYPSGSEWVTETRQSRAGITYEKARQLHTQARRDQ